MWVSPSLDTLATFSLAVAVLALSPGPSNLYIMSQSLAHGPRAGYAAALGMATGSLIYVVASVLGIALLFQQFPAMVVGLKIVGSLYLLYLGVKYWRSAAVSSHGMRPDPGRRLFRQSLLVELTNPKTALFFLAFLPLFVTPERGHLGQQLLVLGILYTLIAAASDCVVATFSGHLGRWLQGRRSTLTQRVSAAMLIGLGLYIGIEQLTAAD